MISWKAIAEPELHQWNLAVQPNLLRLSLHRAKAVLSSYGLRLIREKAKFGGRAKAGRTYTSSVTTVPSSTRSLQIECGMLQELDKLLYNCFVMFKPTCIRPQHGELRDLFAKKETGGL